MKLAVICEDDPVWALQTWKRTIPVLCERGLPISGIWVCPPILSKHRGSDISRWYLKTFGILDFFKLGLFAVTAHITRILGGLGKRPISFEGLAREHNIPFDRCAGPNAPNFIAWLREQQIDVLIILVGAILKEQVLAAPRIGTLNKHAAVLPANRGLYPYFWARLHGTPQGVSFHEVVRGIDEGRLVLQFRITDPAMQTSMVRYYWHVFQGFPEHLAEALEAFAAKRFLSYPTDVPSAYYGLPGPHDVSVFRKRGGRVIQWRDILLATKL
jgi:hypothetical protein